MSHLFDIRVVSLCLLSPGEDYTMNVKLLSIENLLSARRIVAREKGMDIALVWPPMERDLSHMICNRFIRNNLPLDWVCGESLVD